MEIEKVLEICAAYESGYTAGRLNFAVDTNVHSRETELYYAWMVGHNMGIQLELMELDDFYTH
jgi:hypothetical protein